MNFIKLAEVEKLHRELDSKLKAISVDFSTYGPDIINQLINEMDDAKEMLKKLSQLNCEIRTIVNK